MKPIFYIDRKTKQQCKEDVYGASFVRFHYGDSLFTKLFGAPLAYFFARVPWLSAFYGYLQNRPSSAKKIAPFIKTFNVNTSEFAKKDYTSFNDFFTRKLKTSARPIASEKEIAIIPADGRYLFFQNIKNAEGFVVKGKKFTLAALLQDENLAAQYEEGAMAIARLCPTDYHRYHFPCDCLAGETVMINGWLSSVNPAAIKKNIEIFSENKRTVCVLTSEQFGKILFLEIGAIFVGAIHETYEPGSCSKGSEKGYFSFGASSLILLFPPNRIQFDQDLLEASAEHVEIKCLMGQSMGYKINRINNQQ